MPYRWELDSVSPNHPVFIFYHGHLVATNSLALKEAGITRTTTPQKWVIKDPATGEPNGWPGSGCRRGSEGQGTLWGCRSKRRIGFERKSAERARLLGEEAQWESVKGQGTTVTINIPLGRRDRIGNGPRN